MVFSKPLGPAKERGALVGVSQYLEMMREGHLQKFPKSVKRGEQTLGFPLPPYLSISAGPQSEAENAGRCPFPVAHTRPFFLPIVLPLLCRSLESFS